MVILPDGYKLREHFYVIFGEFSLWVNRHCCKKVINCSKKEPSTDQVNKPVNLDALTKWAAEFPEDLKQNIDTIAPMLKKLGYDSLAYPPDYGTPDKEVLENTKIVKQGTIK